MMVAVPDEDVGLVAVACRDSAQIHESNYGFGEGARNAGRAARLLKLADYFEAMARGNAKPPSLVVDRLDKPVNT